MSFDILEKDDGFTIEVLYAGTHTAPLVVHGSIESVQRIGTNQNLASYQYYKSLMWKLGFAICGAIVLTIPIFFPFRMFQQMPFRRKLTMVVISYIIGAALATIKIRYDEQAVQRLELSARKNMLDIVPMNIRNESGSATHISAAQIQ
jgi:hypothetical protein